MAALLYRLGRFCFRRRWTITALWVALLIAVGVGGAALSGPTSNSFTIPGTQAQKAMDLMEQRFPDTHAGGATAVVVFAAPDGSTLNNPDATAAVRQSLDLLRRDAEVADVLDPFDAMAVSPDGRYALAQVTYKVPMGDIPKGARATLESAASIGRSAGLTVESGGDALQEPSTSSTGEIIGLAVAALVLVITFGSVLAAGLPLVTALIGVGIGVSAITATTGFVDLSSNTSVLATMLGLAVAIDYALLIVSRHREELAAGRSAQEAAGLAVGTAGSAVVFAGLTVVIALAGLSVAGLPILTQMGLAAAATVALAVLIALTLLPACLGFAGQRLQPRRRARSLDTSTGRRWARLVTRRPLTVLLTATVALAALAIPALDLRLGMPDDGSAAPVTTQRKAYDLVTKGFGPGHNGPLLVVVDTKGTGSAEGPARRTAEQLAPLSGVAAVTPAVLNQAADTALLTVIPSTAPDSTATGRLVSDIRDLPAPAGATVSVTGRTAINLDMSTKLGKALVPYLALIVVLAFLLLVLAFRSILVPLKATLGFLLTLGATFGAVVAVFQWGWLSTALGVQTTGPIVSVMPVFLVGVLFGLAMDYQVFLATRVREEFVHGASPTQAVVAGVGHGARVVTAAAIIMISVFAGFVPSSDPMIKMMGLALAVGVALDAFVVRMAVIPALLALLGRSAWWLPRWIDRVLPDVDIEGARLVTRAPEATDAPPAELVHN
ncbi:MMPL family transporter [Streptomyces sp. NPDC096176]|uniref:MMPL family transporter n=1 Tax=Streptomyces sp. NPDC096176 TaxID=3366079 RepID=UPI00381348B7